MEVPNRARFVQERALLKSYLQLQPHRSFRALDTQTSVTLRPLSSSSDESN